MLLQFVIIAGVMKTYLDGTGYNTYGTDNQYPEVGYWILRGDSKLYKFQTLYIIYIVSFHIKKGVSYQEQGSTQEFVLPVF